MRLDLDSGAIRTDIRHDSTTVCGRPCNELPRESFRALYRIRYWNLASRLLTRTALSLIYLLQAAPVGAEQGVQVVAGEYLLRRAQGRDTAIRGGEGRLMRARLAGGLRRAAPLDPALAASDCQALMADDLVQSCEPNLLYSPAVIPDDPDFANQWGLDNAVEGVDIRAPAGWEILSSSEDTVVAVLDTGVDYRHPDLADNMWRNPDEIPDNGIDDDRNGYIDDIHGIDATGVMAGDPWPPECWNGRGFGHGTHVAGIIAASGNNGIGVSGVAWRSKIVAVKAQAPCSAQLMSIADLIAGIDYLIALKRSGIKLTAINASWGGGGSNAYSAELYAAIVRARAADIVFVAAAGNNGANSDIVPFYPAGYSLDNIISVAALTRSGPLAFFSNYGRRTVDIGAPGDSIYSTLPDGRYGYERGTSMAAPFVAGAVALLAARHPDLTYQERIQQLEQTVQESSELQGKVVTEGRLDLHLLLSASVPAPPTPTPAPSATPAPTPTPAFAPTPTGAPTAAPRPTSSPSPNKTIGPGTTPGAAAVGGVTLSARFADRNRHRRRATLLIRIGAFAASTGLPLDPLPESCRFVLHASSRAWALGEPASLLGPVHAGSLRFLAAAIRERAGRRARRLLFLSAGYECPGQSGRSAAVRLKFPRGLDSEREGLWRSRVQRQLAALSGDSP